LIILIILGEEYELWNSSIYTKKFCISGNFITAFTQLWVNRAMNCQILTHCKRSHMSEQSCSNVFCLFCYVEMCV
jgi:hypothetical protein